MAPLPAIDMYRPRFVCEEDGRHPASWLAGHRRHFRRHGAFTPDMPLICERFRLVEMLAATDQDQ